MDGFFTNQVNSNYFAGPGRQRGSGLGALALKAAGTAFPILQKYLWPAAKRVGKNFLSELGPEVVGVVQGKTKVKKAVKRAARKTVKRQLGGGRRKRRYTRKTSNSVARRGKKRQSSTKRKSSARSRSRKRTKVDIFSDLK